MANIKWEQIAVMNQHYKKYSFDYFLAAQEKLGIKNIELWCGAPHFWLDSVSYSNCREIKKKAQNYGIKIVSTASPSYQWQYQCASQKLSLIHISFIISYISNEPSRERWAVS